MPRILGQRQPKILLINNYKQCLDHLKQGSLFLFSIMYFMYISRFYESGTLISSAILMRNDSPVYGTTKKEDFQAFLLSFGFVPPRSHHASDNISDHVSALQRVEKVEMWREKAELEFLSNLRGLGTE